MTPAEALASLVFFLVPPASNLRFEARPGVHDAACAHGDPMVGCKATWWLERSWGGHPNPAGDGATRVLESAASASAPLALAAVVRSLPLRASPMLTGGALGVRLRAVF